MTTPHTTCPRCSGSGHIQDDKAVGAAMRAKREAFGISLREAARRMDVSHTYMQGLELGLKHWNEERKAKFLAVLQ